MDIDYTCGHKFQSHPGAVVPADCPTCNQGNLIGAKAKFYMSEDLSKKMREAAMSVKPLTGKERLQPEQEPVADRIMELGNQVHNLACEVQYDEALAGELEDIRGRLWDLGGKVRKAQEREEVIKLAREATDRMAGQKVEVPLGHLYDIGMLRKAGDQ